MKPPTPQELRELAESENESAEWHLSEAGRLKADDEGVEMEMEMYRAAKLQAMALERWAEQLEGRAIGMVGALDRTATYAAALEEIATVAHCAAKAGPLSIKTLDEAWGQFMRLSVMAKGALYQGRTKTPAVALKS